MDRICLPFMLFLFLGNTYGQISFVAQTDSKQSLTGSPFNIEFRLNNAEGNNFQEPDFGGLTKIGGPSRSISTTIINGSMSSSIAYVYSVVGTKTGKYTIGPAKISVGGKVLKTLPITFEIFKSTAKTNNSSIPAGEIFITLNVEPKEAYIGQQVMVTYKLYTQIGIDNIEALKSDPPHDCEIENFTSEFPPEREVIKGKQYTSKVLSQFALFPKISGTLNVNSRSYRVLISDEDPFGFSMKSMFYRTAKVLESNVASVQVLDLPTPIPNNFSSAVGQYKVDFSKVSTSYNLSDAIQIVLKVEGNGSFSQLNPNINLGDTLFDILKPNILSPTKTTETPELIKSQLFEFLLTPKSSGSFIFNPSFCYFDPEQKKYIQRTDTLNITIKESNITPLESAASIRPIIKTNSSTVLNNINLLVYWLLILFPLFIGVLLYLRKNNKFKEWLNKIMLSKQSSRINTIDYEKDLETIIILTAKNLFPETHEWSNLYQIKEFLLTKKLSTKAIKLCSILDQYTILKYNPLDTEKEIAELKNQLIKLNH